MRCVVIGGRRLYYRAPKPEYVHMGALSVKCLITRYYDDCASYYTYNTKESLGLRIRLSSNRYLDERPSSPAPRDS